ncbi:LAMI_0D01024g1_1 [Lachancea mirantina]|uniref:LAMI_0D01024g1_1 n=1 Tax=Lachancea mirantina TaxID=1230905 RepID=A0A1G4J958_9SACH|nr:LAMI_0D01024g1_1 [Lachancea mirantina]
MTAEENELRADDLLHFSNNSLDLRKGFQTEGNERATTGNTPVVGTPQTPFKGQSGHSHSSSYKAATPGAMGELLAMLEDNSMLNQFSSMSSGTASQNQLNSHSYSHSNTESNISSNELSPQQILSEGIPMPVASSSEFQEPSAVSVDKSLPSSNQPCIDPNLLSNANIYMEMGLTDQDNRETSELSFGRRPSELATNAIPVFSQGSRGSISHAVDFWDFPSQRSQSAHESASDRIPQPQLAAPQAHRKANLTSQGLGLLARSPPGMDIRERSTLSLNEGTSPFKIDNDLTQLLNEYNMSYSHQRPTRIRTASFNAVNNPRKGSYSDPRRVQKQRASMSLVDGNNQDLISKLYDEMSNSRSKVANRSWESAIISDDDDEDDEVDAVVNNPISDDPPHQFVHPNVLNSTDFSNTHNNLKSTSFDIGRSAARNSNFSANSSLSPPLHSTISSSSNGKRKHPPMTKTRGSKSTSPLEEEEKPFRCQECPKAFRRSEHLKRHIRSVHSSERPFHCSFCDKKFSRSDNLSQHLKTHKKHGDF